MRVDVTKLRQSLLNLLSNATKFTSEGVVKLAVARESREAGDWLRFDVSDSGIGMTPEQMGSCSRPSPRPTPPRRASSVAPDSASPSAAASAA